MSSRPKFDSPAFSPAVIAYLLALALATFAAYSSIGGSEVMRWDDNVYLNSPQVQSLSLENLVAIFHVEHNGNWHPLTTLSYAVEIALWGQNAVNAKIVNISLHLVVALLFYLLAFRLLLLAVDRLSNSGAIARLLSADRERFALLASLCAATLFALHPQHVESVAWISERKDLLCAIFYLAALLSYIRAASGERSGLDYATIVFMVLALMSKPMAVSLPVAMVLLDVYPLGKADRPLLSIDTIKILLRGKAIYILLSLTSIAITLAYQDPQGGAVFAYLPRLINACAAYWHYFLSIFYPANLSPYYPFAEFSRNPSAFAAIPVLSFAAAAGAAIYLHLKKNTLALVVFAYFTISLLPVIGIVKVGHQAMADRYAYLPTIFFYLLIGVAIYLLYAAGRQRLQRILVAAAFIAICTALGLTTHAQSKHWRNDITLWQRAIDLYPDDASFAYVNLAAAHDARGDKSTEEIEKLILRGIEIDPDNPYNLEAAANFYGQLGQENVAVGYLLRMAEAAPYNYWVRTQLGNIYFNREDYLRAGDYYLDALRVGERSEGVIYRLALIDFHLKRYNDVLAKLELLSSDEFIEEKNQLLDRVQKVFAESAE